MESRRPATRPLPRKIASLAESALHQPVRHRSVPQMAVGDTTVGNGRYRRSRSFGGHSLSRVKPSGRTFGFPQAVLNCA
jgi:hypothetical protein